jgi:tetratricopeptide (TPR) repeat protein
VEELRIPRGEAQIRYRFGELYTHIGDYELADQAHQRALRLVREMDDRIGEAYVLHGMAISEHRQGKLDAARATQRRALALAEVVGERFIEAQAHHELGVIASATGDRPAAIAHLDQADSLFAELGSERRQAMVRRERASLVDPD